MSISTVDFSKRPVKAPRCLECGLRTRLGTGEDAYPDEPELHDRIMWVCDCGAYCTCVPGTIMPRGRPASRETRERHSVARRAFNDLFWQFRQAGMPFKAARREAIIRSISQGYAGPFTFSGLKREKTERAIEALQKALAL